MKKIITLIVVLFIVSMSFAQHHEKHGFAVQYGVLIEPHFIHKELYLPVGVTTSLLYHDAKATLFGGYMFSKHMTAPMLGARVGYEVPMGEKSFVEPYVKTEKIFTHHPYTYYAVGFAYGLKLSKYFTPAISFEYGSEHHEKSVMMGIEIPLNLQFHLKKKRL